MEENENGQYLFHRAYLNDQVEDIAKYLCVFSKRAYIGVGNVNFGYTETGNELYFYESGSINNKTIKLYITFRELLKNK